MRSFRSLALVVGILVVAGCGGGGGGGGGGGSSSGPTEPTLLEPGKVSEGKVVVDIREGNYVPDKLTVPAETQVVWTNSDDVSHSVAKQSGPGSDFNSGPLQPGATFSQVLMKTGTYKIADEESNSSAAPEMTIIVREKSAAQPAPGGAEQPPAEPSPGQSNQPPPGQ